MGRQARERHCPVPLPYMTRTSLGTVAPEEIAGLVAVWQFYDSQQVDSRCLSPCYARSSAKSGAGRKPRLTQPSGGAASAQSVSAVKAHTTQGCRKHPPTAPAASTGDLLHSECSGWPSSRTCVGLAPSEVRGSFGSNAQIQLCF